MSAEKTYADPAEVGRLGEQQLVNDDVLAEMTGLIDAHVAYDGTETLYKDEITELDRQIKDLTAQRKVLTDRKTQQNRQQGSLRSRFSGRLQSILRDPHTKIHPVYRAALLAPTLDQGSYWYPDTFRYAEQLGRDLLEMNEALRTAESSQPVVMVKGDNNREPFRELYVHYAMTRPRAELTPQVGKEQVASCGCGAKHYEPRPYLDIPIAEQTLGAVKNHHFSPVYLTTSGRRITVYNNGHKVEVAQPYEAIKAKKPVIGLPVDNIHGAQDLIAVYEDGGEVYEIRGPRAIPWTANAVCAIGERAVSLFLETITQEAETQAKYPAVIKDMVSFIAKELDLTVANKA